MSLNLIRSTILYSVAAIAQLVERIHGKDEVTGSNPVRGSSDLKYGRTLSCWSRVVAIAGDCKSPLFGVRRFESYLQHQ